MALKPVPPLACPAPDEHQKTATSKYGSFIELRLQHLWMLAEVGRLRLAHPNRVNTVLLPGGAGLNQSQLLVENEGYFARYVRCMARPASGALTTFSGNVGGIDTINSFSFNTGVAESFVEFILLPSERLFAQSQAAADYNLIVFEIDIPIRVL